MGEDLHAYHILSISLYRQHESELRQGPSGIVGDITTGLGFRLLRDGPDALLVLYFHGATGTLCSRFRLPRYLAIPAGAPSRIHTVDIDYRGFGTSFGPAVRSRPAYVRVQVAGNPPTRIVDFGQSLGTVVATALVHHLAVVAVKEKERPEGGEAARVPMGLRAR